MTVRFRTITTEGRELELEDIQAVVRAWKEGMIHADSMLFDSQQDRWLRADEHDAVQAAIAALQGGEGSAVMPVAKLDPPPNQISEHSGPIPDIPPQATDTMLDRLRMYIGPNWQSHYRKTFERLLRARKENTNAGWTWNWPAALFPIWFLYRRLYAAFLGFLALYITIGIADDAMASSHGGGGLIALLYIGQVILMGFSADRLLFRKAISIVSNPRLSQDPATLEASGRPHNVVMWILLFVVGILILSSILYLSGALAA